MGNFAFDLHSGNSPHGDITILVRGIVRDGAVQRVSYIPIRINEQGQPVPVDPQAGQDIVQSVQELSADFDTQFQVGEKDVMIEIPVAVAAG